MDTPGTKPIMISDTKVTSRGICGRAKAQFEVMRTVEPDDFLEEFVDVEKLCYDPEQHAKRMSEVLGPDYTYQIMKHFVLTS